MSTYVDEEWVLDYMTERGWDLSQFNPLMIDEIHGTINNMLPSFLSEDTPIDDQERYISDMIDWVLKDDDPYQIENTLVDIVDRDSIQENPDDRKSRRRSSRRSRRRDDGEDA